MGLLWLVGGWILYFAIHSLLATSKLKEYGSNLGLSPQNYRLMFNLVAVLTLLPIFYISSQIKTGYVFIPGNLSKFGGLILAAWGIVLGKIAFKSYDTKAFLGLGSLKGENKFASDGLLKHVRHPLYSASILLIVGYFFYDPKWNTLVSTSMLIVYFVVGSLFEEKKLIRTFGDEYLKYKRKTPMFFPRFWKRG